MRKQPTCSTSCTPTEPRTKYYTGVLLGPRLEQRTVAKSAGQDGAAGAQAEAAKEDDGWWTRHHRRWSATRKEKDAAADAGGEAAPKTPSSTQGYQVQGRR